MKRLLLLWLSIVAILAGCKKGNEPPTPEPAPAPIPLGTVELSEDVMVYTPPQNVADPVVSYDGKTLVLKVGSEARSLRMGTSATYTNYKSQQTGTPKKNDILVVPLNKGKEPHFLRLLSDPRFQNGEMTVITAAPQAKDVVYAINTDTTINLAPYLHLLSEKEGELSEKEWIYDQEYLQKTGKLFDIKKTDLLKVKTEREGDKVILKIEQGWDSSMFKESKNLNVKLKTLLTCEMSPKLRVRLRKYKKQNGFDIATGSLLGDVKIKLDAEAEAKLKSKATSEWISLVDKSLGWIPIGGGPLAVTPRCQIKFRWGISGELEFKLNVVTWEAPFDYEAGYDKNRQGSWFFSKDYKSGRFKWFDDYSMTAKGVLSPDLRVGVSFRFNNLQNLEGTLGIGFNANLEANGKFSKHSQELNGNIYYETKTYLFAGFEVDFAKWFNLGYDFVYNLATTEKEELILGEKKEDNGTLPGDGLPEGVVVDSQGTLIKWPNEAIPQDGIVKIPNTVKVIGKGAFKNCNKLRNVIFHNKVTVIESMAFYNCTELISINMPNSVKKIGIYTLSRCKNLKEATLPSNTLSELPNGLFDGCSSLSKINLPIGLKSIGNRAFADCTSLRNVNVPEGVIKIGGDAFTRVQGSIILPSTIKDLGTGEGSIFTWPFQTSETITIGRTVYLKAKTPPNIYFSTGYGKPVLGTFKVLYVPAGCKQKYLDVGIYGVNASNVEEYDFE